VGREHAAEVAGGAKAVADDAEQSAAPFAVAGAADEKVGGQAAKQARERTQEQRRAGHEARPRAVAFRRDAVGGSQIAGQIRDVEIPTVGAAKVHAAQQPEIAAAHQPAAPSRRPACQPPPTRASSRPPPPRAARRPRERRSEARRIVSTAVGRCARHFRPSRRGPGGGAEQLGPERRRVVRRSEFEEHRRLRGEFGFCRILEQRNDLQPVRELLLHLGAVPLAALHPDAVEVLGGGAGEFRFG
ncbi:hypothetical protein B4Q13_18150, partial [Lacticaseibacillus rhamnosus]